MLLVGTIIAIAVGSWRWCSALTNGPTVGLRTAERCLATLDGPCLERVLAGTQVDMSSERWRTLITEVWLTAQALASTATQAHPLPTLKPAQGAEVSHSLRERGALWYATPSSNADTITHNEEEATPANVGAASMFLSPDRQDNLAQHASAWLHDDKLGAAGPHLRARAARLQSERRPARASGPTRSKPTPQKPETPSDSAGSTKERSPSNRKRRLPSPAADRIPPASAFLAMEYYQSAVAEHLCLRAKGAPNVALTRAEMTEARASQQAGLMLALCLASSGRLDESHQLLTRLAQQRDSPAWLETLRDKLARGNFPAPPPLAFEP